MGALLDEGVAEEVPDRPRRKVPVWFVVALVGVGVAYGVVTLAGRGADRGPAAAGADEQEVRRTDIDPCSLVTADEAAEVMGPIEPPAERPGMGVIGGQRACYYPVLGAGGPGVVIGAIASEQEMNLGGMGRSFGTGTESIADLGDDAQWLAPFRLLAVAVGDTFLSVQMIAPGESYELSRDKAVALATVAARRL